MASYVFPSFETCHPEDESNDADSLDIAFLTSASIVIFPGFSPITGLGTVNFSSFTFGTAVNSYHTANKSFTASLLFT